MLAKEILDRWATNVVPKYFTGYSNYKKKFVVFQDWTKQEFSYSLCGFSEDLVLWARPQDCLAIEFEGTKEQNDKWISQTEMNCRFHGFDYCICEHEKGKSKYVYCFNVEGMKSFTQRKTLAKMLVPKEAIDLGKLDLSNFQEKHLVPIIDMPHWKHGTIHKIISGKNPLEHENVFPNDLEVVEPSNVVVPIPSCDVKVVNDLEMLRIIETDIQIKNLLNGITAGYPSPSEARMSLLVSLVYYNLTDSQIKEVMSLSRGLNWAEKPYLHESELLKARLYCSRRRKRHE